MPFVEFLSIEGKDFKKKAYKYRKLFNKDTLHKYLQIVDYSARIDKKES